MADEIKKEDGNGKLQPQPANNIKVMMIRLDVEKWAEFCLHPKIGDTMPPVEVSCDFLYNTILCYAMLEGAKTAVDNWNLMQQIVRDPQKKEHKLIDFMRHKR